MQVRLKHDTVEMRQSSRRTIHLHLPGRAAWGVSRFQTEGDGMHVIIDPLETGEEAPVSDEQLAELPPAFEIHFDTDLEAWYWHIAEPKVSGGGQPRLQAALRGAADALEFALDVPLSHPNAPDGPTEETYRTISLWMSLVVLLNETYHSLLTEEQLVAFFRTEPSPIDILAPPSDTKWESERRAELIRSGYGHTSVNHIIAYERLSVEVAKAAGETAADLVQYFSSAPAIQAAVDYDKIP